MAVTYGADNGQVEYQNKGGWDLSKATTFTWTAKNNGKTDADIYLIFKLTDSWTWTETDGSCKVPAGEKVTCSIDISSFADRNKTLSITFANYASGYTGTVIYDDIKAGDLTLFDFNTDKYDAFKRGYENTEEMIPEIKIVYDENYIYSGSTTDIGCMRPQVAGAKALQVNGKMLNLTLARTVDVTAELFDITGHRVATLHRGSLSAGTHQFMVNVAKGTYFVKIAGQGINLTQKMTVK